MSSQPPARTAENPLVERFDNQTLKAMDNRELAPTGRPRTSFLPATMGEAMEMAKLMAVSNFVPPHLRGKPGDCLAVVMQADQWGMSPFSVAQKTYFVNDRMAYESQLVAAVINASNALDGRLDIEWEGKDNNLVCIVSGKLKGHAKVKHRRVAINTITTRNSPLWKQDPEQQLGYYAQRAWVRLHAPEVLMGVYTPDEIREINPDDAPRVQERSITAMIEAQADPNASENAAEGDLQACEAVSNGDASDAASEGADVAQQPAKKQTPEEWAAQYVKDAEKAVDREELAALQRRSQKALDKLRADKPDLFRECEQAITDRNIDFDADDETQGRTDEQHGDQHDGTQKELL